MPEHLNLIVQVIGLIAIGGGAVLAIDRKLSADTKVWREELQRVAGKIDKLTSEVTAIRLWVPDALKEYRRVDLCSLCAAEHSRNVELLERKVEGMDRVMRELEGYTHSRIHEIANKAQIALSRSEFANGKTKQ